MSGANLMLEGWARTLEFGANIQSARAYRKSVRAQMAALQKSWDWNLDVMKQNVEDVTSRSQLQSWGSGINPFTGSNAAIIASNEKVMRDEIDFQREQYETQMGNLRAQSKKRYLGIF